MQADKIIRDQVDIDEEIERLGVLADRLHASFQPCVDAQTLVLANRMDAPAIAARWGGGHPSHDSACSAREWLLDATIESPSKAWEGICGFARSGGAAPKITVAA